MKRRNFIKFGAVAAIAPIVSSAKTTHEDKIEQNKAAMKRFETAINTADEALLNELVDPEAPFVTPASKDPLYGGSGYNAIIKMMRASFPDVQVGDAGHGRGREMRGGVLALQRHSQA